MSKMDAEDLFASMVHRWSTGDISNFERDYAEDIEVDFDGEKLFLEDLKQRTLFFNAHFEVLKLKILDFIYDEDLLAVRLEIQLRERKEGGIIEDIFHWFYKIKNEQVIKYWAITNYSFGFSSPKAL